MGNPVSLLENLQAKGEVLSEGKWKNYVEGLKGTDRPFTAILLENTARWMASLEETSRAVNVGNFDRFAFPLIRAVFPNLIAQDLVSVQPMDGPVGLVFFFDLIYGSNKGGIVAGTHMFSSATGHPGDDYYSGPEIRDEVVAAGAGAAAFVGVLAYTPVEAGTVVITDGTQVIRDNGAGGLVGDINPGAVNTVNYNTGAVVFTFAAVVALGINVTADYEYDNEANSQVPEVDFQLTSAPVVASINKLRTRYSLEAAQNLKALHGLSAETELVVALAQELRFEIDRKIIRDVNSFAMATAVTWPQAPGVGVTFSEHKLSFVDILIRGSNNIFQLVRRGQPNFLVMGVEVSSTVESIPGFKASDAMQAPNGVVFAGTLASRWRCYKDPYNIDGTAGGRNFLIGYKGSTFLDAGYVYAPYIPFYTTPTVVLDDFIARKGMATQWGSRQINGRFYCRGSVTGTWAP
jgi:hypothetical protein